MINAMNRKRAENKPTESCRVVQGSGTFPLYWPGSGYAEPYMAVGGTEFHRYREKQSPRCKNLRPLR